MSRVWRRLVVLLVLLGAAQRAHATGSGWYANSSLIPPPAACSSCAGRVGPTGSADGACTAAQGYWAQEQANQGIAANDRINAYQGTETVNGIFSCMWNTVNNPSGRYPYGSPYYMPHACTEDPVGSVSEWFLTTNAGTIVRDNCVYLRSYSQACDVVSWDSSSPPQPTAYKCPYYNSGVVSGASPDANGQLSGTFNNSVPSGQSSTAQSCPAGTVQTTVNGTTTCTPAAGSTASSSQTATNKDATGATTGSSTTTTTTTVNNTNNTVTTSTTVTNYNSSGAVTGSTTTSKTEPISDSDMAKFCKQNPTLSICKVSSFTGTCSSGFTGDGDAVEVSLAKEIYKRNCTLFETPTSLSDLGNQVATGADPEATQHPALAANRTSIPISGSLDQSTFLPSGGLQDQVVPLPHGQSLTIPWSTLNQYLGYMGVIVVAFALVFGAKIIAEGV